VQLISAVVRPSKVGDVCGALQVFGFQGFTVIPASGFGKHRAPREIYRGVELATEFQEQAKIEIVAPDDDVHGIVGVICQAAATGGIGDGKVWVTPVVELVRIRTRELDLDAL
jgi:nitrogen regulatory protein P-II 1